MRTLALLFALTLSCLAQPLSPNDPAFLQSTSPLRRGLVGYWRLEEASGTRYDCSSQGGHLTSNNSVGNSTGKVGNGATFLRSSVQTLTAGSSNYLQFTISSSFTLSAWVNLTNVPTTDEYIMGHRNGTLARGWFLGTVNGLPYFQLQSDGSAYRYILTSTSITNGVWRFVVATYSGSGTTNGMNVYVDNVLDIPTDAQSVGAMTDIDNTSVFILGDANSNDTIRSINGMIDEAGVWNRVLTTAERTQLYNAGLGTHFPWAHP